MDYRSTLNLPTTDFPMKADLPKREPQRMRWWHEQRIYERRLERNAANPPWILHDGPPYANGEFHVGHLLNRVLKDVFVKFHMLDGRYANFVPGWDMHGLPIETETLKHLGLDFRKTHPLELRAKCRERALHWLDVQRDTILRMGNFGHFDHPYRTIDKEFEATIVDALGTIAASGQLYKGLRSTLWCIHDETALAEAEIEYRDHVSPSIYVRFRATAAQRADLLARMGAADPIDAADLSVLIWTTTPWTLPANVAIAVKPTAEYGLYLRGRELLIVADQLADAVFGLVEGGAPRRIGGAKGQALIEAAVRHPFLDRDSVIVGADYVELETGTGAVHTAPGHGSEDFETGVRCGLPVINPVNASGHFTAEAGPYAGRQIFEANEAIVEDLRASGALYFALSYSHSYPHCWRCKNPVIFRATSQWFMAMDVNRLRKRIEEQIPAVHFFPGWGQARLEQMIENHPEWCLSRQRTWGTPIPAVVCIACDESILDLEVARIVAERFRHDGADVWWSDDVKAFLPPNFSCPACRGTNFVKEMNIVDIWFESGVTHLAVLGSEKLPWPADLYLEGSDQFRGWFRSNIITAVAVKGKAPYRNIVATGMVVDSNGHAMHKSAGNSYLANDAIEKYGADVLRLWVASAEFTAELRFGDQILQAVSSVYRNLRYRLRMLLGLIEDFSQKAVVPHEHLQPLDRLALAAFAHFSDRATAAYRRFDLHDVYLALVEYDASDLSRFYIDVLKDRMYANAPDSPERRSAQTVLWTILRGLLALLAPILSFTSEEAWQHVPAALREDDISVFDLVIPKERPQSGGDAAALETWLLLKSLRAIVAASEGERDFQLQAQVRAGGENYKRLKALGDGLREALVVSAATLERDDKLDLPQVELRSADGEKCSRCWKYLPLGSDEHHPTLCRPCVATVLRLTHASA
ncbi:MAG TPA: isoleucine--tRNA ligase [Candidatus Baltobacteraceae bacterium]|jgi:isoleucyl-tRNA synthetase|nr:isoleucine--tRNA ligase [Candidatus Baltobacteraceae bacterium]